MLLNENQRVAQLLHLFWCAARLFQVLLNGESTCSSTPALVLVCCQAVSSVVNENQRVAQLCTCFGVARLFQVLLMRINV